MIPRDGTATALLRAAIVLIFLWFGWMKFLPYEAEGVAGIARGYPLFAPLYPLLGVAGASAVIGTIEIATGLLIAIGHWVPRASLVGGAMGVCTFLVTLSFMIGAPNAFEASEGAPALGSTGQFLVKDIVLLAACLLLARDGLARSRAPANGARSWSM